MMTARSCEEITESRRCGAYERHCRLPSSNYSWDPKIDGLIERLKMTCGPTYEEIFQALLARLKT